MARPDPYKNYKFRVAIDGFTVAGFTRVSGLEQHTDTIKYREGGDNHSTRKLIGQTDYPPITLERGMSIDYDFSVWASAVHNILANVAPEGLVKHAIQIQLLGKTSSIFKPVVKKQWLVFRCWPSDYVVGDLDAMGSEVLMERIILQSEGWVVEPI